MTDALDRASIFLCNNIKINMNNIYVNYFFAYSIDFNKICIYN